MKIDVIGVTKQNMMEVVSDDSVYVIHKDTFYRDGSYKMEHIKDVSVKEMLSEKSIVVKITD